MTEKKDAVATLGTDITGAIILLALLSLISWILLKEISGAVLIVGILYIIYIIQKHKKGEYTKKAK